jgi:hypothetical protein
MDLLAIVSVMVLSVSLGLAAAGGCLALLLYVITHPVTLRWNGRMKTPTSRIDSGSAASVQLARELRPVAVPVGR